MWSLGMGLSDSAAKARSIVWPGLPGKSIVNRANTVSTVLMRPKPQLRCMQKPLVGQLHQRLDLAPFDLSRRRQFFKFFSHKNRFLSRVAELMLAIIKRC